MTTTKQHPPTVNADEAPLYEFVFEKGIGRDNHFPELHALPGNAYTTLRVVFCANESEARLAARSLFGAEKAEHAMRMGLEHDGLPPAAMQQQLDDLAEQYSKQNGESWAPRPIDEIPLNTFARLLSLANESHWERRKRTHHLHLAVAQTRGIDVESALQRVVMIETS